MSIDEAPAPTGPGPLAALAGRYLTFRLGSEEYGLEILRVREIIGLKPITRVPRAPHFVRGVINLRGKVVPVVDLRLKFGLEAAADSGQTCIIVVEVEHETGLLPIGLVVDEVFEVRDLAVDQIEGTPEFGPTVETAFILGLGKVGQGVVILLEINRVLSAGELVLVDQTAR